MSYVALASAFLLASLIFMGVAVAVRRPSRSWWWSTLLTAVTMVVLTAVFDTAMIVADLFRFDESALVGIRVGLAPLEDFAWPLAAVAVIPSVFLLATGRDRAVPRHRADPRDGPTQPAGACSASEESTR